MSFFGKMISDLFEPVGNGRKNNEADVKIFVPVFPR